MLSASPEGEETLHKTKLSFTAITNNKKNDVKILSIK